MSQRNYVNLIGETLGDDLRVGTILRYQDNEPVWGATCGKCGSSGIAIPHRLYRQGNARCISSIHGHAQTKPATSSSSQVGSRDDGWAEHYAEMLKPEEETPPAVDPEIAAKKARQTAENQRRTAELHQQHSCYYIHCLTHGWPLDKLFTFKQWCSIDDFFRAQILERQASGYYEGAQEETK